MRNVAACLITLALVSGCASTAPGGAMPITNAYDGDHPRADTAVFIATDTKTPTPSFGRIHFTDNKQYGCLVNGCPYAVRVKPGRHEFKVRYAGDLNNGLYKEAFIRVEFDMKPRHVYVARYYQDADKQVLAKIEDLGEKPAYIPGRDERMTFDVAF